MKEKVVHLLRKVLYGLLIAAIAVMPGVLLALGAGSNIAWNFTGLVFRPTTYNESAGTRSYVYVKEKDIQSVDGCMLVCVDYFYKPKELTIPGTFQGKPVVYIAEKAFADHTRLTSITIPDTVIGISADAFLNCTNLIQIENGVSYVDKWVIDCDPSVITVSLREGTVGIANEAFKDCNLLEEVFLPSSITSIDSYAFAGCSALKIIELSNNVTRIGDSAFEGCSALKIIELSNRVTHIGDSAFEGCSSLESIIVDSDNTVYHSSGNCLIETQTKTLIVGCKTSVIPDDGSVTHIANSAFRGCKALKSITIPVSVTSIGMYAFYGCSNLTSITFGGTVEQWYAIDMTNSWYGLTGDYIIYCTDGKIEG